MTTTITELDNLIQILEAQVPANPRSPRNQRLAKRLERELAKYFKSLEDAFPYNEIARLYDLYVKESLGSETRNILDPLLATFDADLAFNVNGQLAETYMSGQAEMITWGKTKGGIPIAYEGPPIEQAINWAEKQGAKLVTQMDEETKRRLAKTVSDGIANKRGVPGLARDIRKEFIDMTRYRSQLIARTETANALSQASLDNMKDMGIEGKEWITSGDDRVSDECLGNEADGVIPVGQAFSGGVMAPPQHPDCRCTIAPARLPK
ncbi:MAG: minor capsid protein [Desulfobacteraceae bacterium]|nr:minor capsid protein [Desulfobacteraceae bacterium]